MAITPENHKKNIKEGREELIRLFDTIANNILMTTKEEVTDIMKLAVHAQELLEDYFPEED